MNIFKLYKDKIINILKSANKENLIKLPENLNSINVDLPPSKFNCDISTNVAMVLSKSNEKSPIVLAEILSKLIKQNDHYINDISIEKPGFFNIRLNLDGYFPISSDAKDINKYNDIFDVLGTIEYARYKSFNQNFILQMGNLWGLTFGHGNLLKEYSNMLDYPRIKKTGIYLFYRTNKRDIKVDLFISDIQEINKSGGLFGVRGSILISNKFPLTLGLGFIQDNNQFSSIKDYIDNPQTIEEFSLSRKVNAIQFDYNCHAL